jgi:hypothetical protein
LHPESGDDADNYDATFAQIEYEGGELRRAVEAGELVVKNPLTRLPLTFIAGHALNRGVVMIADLQAFASGLGLSVVVEAPEQAAPAQSPAEPAPVVAESSNAPAWTVRKPQRYKGYAAPLYRLLSTVHREGKPRPSARDLVEAWRINRPAEIAQVLPDGFDYYDAKGNIQPADLESIRKAIKRMTSAR